MSIQDGLQCKIIWCRSPGMCLHIKPSRECVVVVNLFPWLFWLGQGYNPHRAAAMSSDLVCGDMFTFPWTLYVCVLPVLSSRLFQVRMFSCLLSPSDSPTPQKQCSVSNNERDRCPREVKIQRKEKDCHLYDDVVHAMRNKLKFAFETQVFHQQLFLN